MTAYASTWHPSYYDIAVASTEGGSDSVSAYANTAVAVSSAAAAVLLLDIDTSGGGDVDWWW